MTTSRDNLLAASNMLASAIGSLSAITAAIEQARALIQAELAPVVQGPVPPAPTPSPTPTVPQAVQAAKLDIEALNQSRMIEMQLFHWDSRYERFQRLGVTDPTKNSFIVNFQAYNLATGGAPNTFLGTRYGLLVDGVEMAFVTVDATSSYRQKFTLDTTNLSVGWHKLQITGCVQGETAPTCWLAVTRTGAQFPKTGVPLQSGSYEFSHGSAFKTGMMPFPNPRAVPLTKKRKYGLPTYNPTATNRFPRTQLHCEHLVPFRGGDPHRPNINKYGVVSTFDKQSYFWDDLHRKYPMGGLIDGPRNVGTVSFVTHVEHSTAVINGVPRNNTYFSDPWRIGKISEDGTITTLAGFRNKGNIALHWGDLSTFTVDSFDVIGDWSAIPKERWGFREIWGFTWDERTLHLDFSRTIPEENNENPHTGLGPVMFVADTFNNRIIKLQFNALRHGVPPIVTEFITNMSDPWEVVYVDGHIYVNERTASRISVWDATTGAYVRTLLQGEPGEVVGTWTTTAGSQDVKLSITPVNNVYYYLEPEEGDTLPGFSRHVAYASANANTTNGTARFTTWPGSYQPVKATASKTGKLIKLYARVDPNRMIMSGAALDVRRVQVILLPEGLYYQDGWMYFSSMAQAQVRRVRLDGTGLEVVRSISIDANSNYAKLAVADGTFLPRGTTLTWTWSNAQFGGPEVVFSDGKWMTSLWNLQSGGTGDWTTHSGYGTAGACTHGKLTSCNMMEGMYRISKSEEGDIPNNRHKAGDPVELGKSEYYSKGFNLIYGPNGYGYYDLDLPWGTSANMDLYLQASGHVKPA